MASEKEVDHAEMIRHLQCDVHEKDLVPLFCTDCDGPVCLDCLTIDHVGHKMGKLSECIDDKVSQLNDVVQKNDAACFNLNGIVDNLQKRRQEVKKQVEEMVRQVTTRKEEILKEVKNVCQQTIEQIAILATEIENPMVKDEQLLKNFMSCNMFRKGSDEDCIKSFYYYNKLKILAQKYSSGDHDDVPFTLVTRGLSADKVFELVRSEVTDDHLSSDENLEQNDKPTNPHEIDICEGDIDCFEYKKPFTEGAIDSFTLVSGDSSLLYSKDVLYYQSNTNVKKVMQNIQHFTYVSETDEIVVIPKGQSRIYRRPLSTKSNELLFFISFKCEEVVCIEHDVTAYLVVVLKEVSVWGESVHTIYTIDDTGCDTKPTQTFKSIFVRKGSIKLHKSSFMIIDVHTVCVTKGLTFDSLFTYTGKIGNNHLSTFSPADVCTDSDGNYLVIDSHDSTVHLLDPKGKFLQIIMSTEDGLRGIECIAMDDFGWLWMGRKDGMVHFVNYEHFKSTTRKERCLQRQKKMKQQAVC